MAEQNIKILVACHKADPNIRQNEVYMPIQVGKAVHSDLDLGFQCDNTGDNISEKNGSYCELTALYWAWKNLKDVDFIGLAHYRRYLDIEEKDMKKDLLSGKIIIPEEYVSPISNFEKLVSFIGYEDAYIMIDSILELYPEMRQSIIGYFFNSNKYSVFNMLITDANTFNRYCEFLFNILGLVEKRIIKSGYNRQRRTLGYMGEILLGLWLYENKGQLKRVSTINGALKTNKYKLKLRNLIRTISFKMNNFPKEKEIPIYDAVTVGLKNNGITLEHI